MNGYCVTANVCYSVSTNAKGYLVDNKLARDIIDRMVSEISEAEDLQQARDRAWVQHGAAKSAYLLGLISFDEWVIYDESGTLSVRLWEKKRS